MIQEKVYHVNLFMSVSIKGNIVITLMSAIIVIAMAE